MENEHFNLPYLYKKDIRNVQYVHIHTYALVHTHMHT